MADRKAPHSANPCLSIKSGRSVLTACTCASRTERARTLPATSALPDALARGRPTRSGRLREPRPQTARGPALRAALRAPHMRTRARARRSCAARARAGRVPRASNAARRPRGAPSPETASAPLAPCAPRTPMRAVRPDARHAPPQRRPACLEHDLADAGLRQPLGLEALRLHGALRRLPAPGFHGVEGEEGLPALGPAHAQRHGEVLQVQRPRGLEGRREAHRVLLKDEAAEALGHGVAAEACGGLGSDTYAHGEADHNGGQGAPELLSSAAPPDIHREIFRQPKHCSKVVRGAEYRGPCVLFSTCALRPGAQVTFSVAPMLSDDLCRVCPSASRAIVE